MTSTKAIYALLGMILVFIVIRFIVGLVNNEPAGSPSPSFPIEFPICQGPGIKKEVKIIQKYLNANKKTFVTPLLILDGKFGSKTEWELKDQTASICVSKTLYQSMA